MQLSGRDLQLRLPQFSLSGAHLPAQAISLASSSFKSPHGILGPTAFVAPRLMAPRAVTMCCRVADTHQSLGNPTSFHLLRVVAPEREQAVPLIRLLSWEAIMVFRFF